MSIKIKMKPLNSSVIKKENSQVEKREKIPAGIDFDIKISKKAFKEDIEDESLLTKIYTQEHYAEWNKNKDKNLFEEIIDKMMVESFMDETFKPYIDEVREIIGKKLPKAKKRFAILCTLDKNRNLLRKAKIYNGVSVSKMEHITDYIHILRKYVQVTEVEKKKFGEVMTPIDLVKEMLGKLPREVWTNPNLKWLDPCNGVGPFGALVVGGLMRGLAKWEPDEEKRYKHIVENMVYVCELQPKNMFLWMCMMDPKDEYAMNVYCGSFLDAGFDKHMKEVWGVEKFDVVVGNPPYQESKEGNKKTKPIWNEFVTKVGSFLIKKSGYLCFVHPNGWRNVDGIFKDVQLLFRKNKLIYLNINSVQKGEQTFGASTSYDYYILQLENSNGQLTTISNQYDKIEMVDISNMECIPNYDILKINKLFASENDQKVSILYSRSMYGTDKENMNKEETDIFIYPCVYSVLKNGFNLFYSSLKKEHFGVKKIILGNGANPTWMEDKNGEYGLTQFAFGIVDDENYDLIVDIMTNKIDKLLEITLATKFISTAGNPIFYPKIISLFKKDFWKQFA